MTKTIRFSLVILIIIVVAAILAFWLIAPLSNQAPGTQSQFTFNNTTYKFTAVEITLQQQEQGLMNFTVTNSTFALFVFNKSGIYPFWMMDTYSPLDIIWINNTKVVYIADAPPCVSYSPNQTACVPYNTYPSGHAANYVIEAHSGFVNRTGMHVGSSLYIS